MKTKNKHGFTLIEIALALLVASIGLLGIFSLFPVGVQMNKTALDETQAALFAEQVLNGIRAQAQIKDWDTLRTQIELPPPTPDVWVNPDSLTVRAGSQHYENEDALRYRTMGALAGGTDEYFDFGIRYKLEIYQVPNSPRYSIRLYVRPGEYGPTNNEHVFYTELYNHGQK